MLVKVLRANTHAALRLLPSCAASPQLQSYVLLSGEHLPHAWYVHSSLLRRARRGGAGMAALVSHLACQSLATPQQQAFVESAAADLQELFMGQEGDCPRCGNSTPGVWWFSSPHVLIPCHAQAAGSAGDAKCRRSEPKPCCMQMLDALGSWKLGSWASASSCCRGVCGCGPS